MTVDVFVPSLNLALEYPLLSFLFLFLFVFSPTSISSLIKYSYNGEQHYKQVSTSRSVIERQKLDAIKREEFKKIGYPLSSVLCPLSSVLCPLSSVLCPLSSVLCPLSSVLSHLLNLSYSSSPLLTLSLSRQYLKFQFDFRRCKFVVVPCWWDGTMASLLPNIPPTPV